MRTRRQLDRSWAVRVVLTVWLGCLVVVAGSSAYVVGTLVRRGQLTLPFDAIRTATTVGCLMVLVGFVLQTARLVERLDTDLLLTTVSVRAVVLGIVLYLVRRSGAGLILPLVCGGVGFAVGARSPASILTASVALAGLVGVTALFGVSFSVAVALVTRRSPRFRRYRNVFVVVLFVLGSIGWIGVIVGRVSVSLPTGWFSVALPAWFADLAFLGAPAGRSDSLRSVGALVTIVVGGPLQLRATTVLAERVWAIERVGAATLHRSRSLVGEGIAERLFVGHVSRPVLTVARKRWLQERRVPRGLMVVGLLVVFLPGIVLPTVAAGKLPGISLVLLVFGSATATGLAFGLDPIGTEYASLPVTLTTISGTQFVCGTILAGIGVGAPITAATTIGLSLVSPLGFLEATLLALVGAFLCVCSITLAVAIGMETTYSDLLPQPMPLTSATVHAEVGRWPLIRLGTMVGLIGLVCLPMVGGYGVALVEPGPVRGVPIAIVRIGSLLLTTGFALVVSIVAYRRGVRLYDHYTLS